MAKNKNALTIEERRSIYLEMLREIDSFCRQNNIRYSLSSGTLIGAIRHKGFIPWDDDLDITMPLPDLLRFKKIFKSEKISYCDINSSLSYDLAFPRLVYNPTYSKTGYFNKGFGVAIDVYVVVGLPSNEKEYIEEGKRLYEAKIRRRKFSRKLSHYTPIPCTPGMRRASKKFCEFMYNNAGDYNKSKRFFRIASPMRDNMIKKNILDFDFFDGLEDIMLEDVKCLATTHAHEYLTQRYGNYMELPPENQRHPYHGGIFYWK